jgi:radical SAM protein with 4Fe4S-binding SPASM domain
VPTVAQIFSNMSWALFTKLIEDLQQFPERPKKLMLTNFGEPLINPRIADMVALAKQKNISDRIEITTNALLLNQSLSHALVEGGLTKLLVSINGLSSDDYVEMCGAAVDFTQLVENIRYFHKISGSCTVYVKIADIAVPHEEDKERFYDTFSGICDEIAIECIDKLFENTSVDISSKSLFGLQRQNKQVCTSLFTRFVVCHDGIAAPCCIDWAQKMPVGDANTESLYDIWNGKKMNELRRIHLQKKRKTLPLCCDCSYLHSCDVDNIDSFADELLTKLHEK